MNLFEHADRAKMPDGIPEDVVLLFENFALLLIKDGWEKYSARAILHRIRWHYNVEKKNRNFKANDHWTPAMSRWFMRKYPQYDGFFETRNAHDEAEG